MNPSYEQDIEALVIKNITDELSSSYNNLRKNFNFLKIEELADLRFDEPGKIDQLLGADVYIDILEEGIGVRKDGRKRNSDSTEYQIRMDFIWQSKNRYRSLLVNYEGKDNLEFDQKILGDR